MSDRSALAGGENGDTCSGGDAGKRLLRAGFAVRETVAPDDDCNQARDLGDGAGEQRLKRVETGIEGTPLPNPLRMMIELDAFTGLRRGEFIGKQPYWPSTQWRYYGKPELKRAGITKHVTYHTFRHTFGTLLNANGENPKVVQELLCHASMKVTTDVYMQAVSPQKREAQSKLVKMVMKTASA